ncbi:MAG: PD-(D/E)XK nuclease family protein [Muribaculaceae bacterium]|nr:PD-(D/E)XK nuclease family protein [Muribaculaceae bacterium]
MDNNKLVEYALQFRKDIDKMKSNIPYAMNVIDLLHANENAHSRILLWLLRYNKNGRHFLLESFFNMISKYHEIDIELNFDNLYLNCEEYTEYGRRIDLIITNETKDFCVIIENKVNGAVDQERQLEDYISDAILYKHIDSEQIIVIYLTLNEEKRVSESSLTAKAKEWLGFSDEDHGRFLSINYNDHILKWLEEEVLPHTEYNEYVLISALTQYIDHLKGILNIRSSEQKINKIMTQKIINDQQLYSIEKVVELKEAINAVEHATNAVLEKQIPTIAEEKLLKPIRAYLQAHYPGFSIYPEFALCGFHLKIRNPNWNKCSICFNKEDGIIIYGVVHEDAKENHIDMETENKIKQIDSYRHSLWWPLWKRVSNDFLYVDDKFWIALYKGEKNMATYINEKIDEIIRLLDGMIL